MLFEPELNRPVKTLDLPLGGAKGFRTALQLLLDFILISNRNQQGEPVEVEDSPEDVDGSLTLEALDCALRLARRITGNESGSLGLHPAVYFYGPTGRHSSPMFMGTVSLIGKHLADNDRSFFKRFTSVREALEAALIEHKDLIATILQKHVSTKRAGTYHALLDALVKRLGAAEPITESWLVTEAGLTGKIVTGEAMSPGVRFSDDAKSAAFIRTYLSAAPRCPECRGYLDAEKSVSYDHVVRKREGGDGATENCALTHPYCNQSVKQ